MFIFDIRKRLHMTQLEFAVSIGVTPQSVSIWERCRKDVAGLRPKYARKISEIVAAHEAAAHKPGPEAA